jgi:hypothetical protein
MTAFSIFPGATSAGWFWVALSTVLFFVIGRLSLADGRRRWSYTAPLLVIGTVEAIWGLAQSAVEGREVAGTFESPDHLAAMLGMMLPLGIGGLLAAVTSAPVAQSVVTPMLRSAMWLLTSVVLAAGIAASFSRTGVLATLAALLVMVTLELARRVGRYRRLIVSAGVLVVLAGMTWFAVMPVGERSGEASAAKANGRHATWGETGRLVAAYPLAGVGLGNFHPAILRYQRASTELSVATPRNELMLLLAELGLAGSAMVLTLFVAVLVRAARTALSPGDPDARLLALGCAGGLVAIGVHGLAGVETYDPSHALVLAWVGGLGASVPPVPSPGPSGQLANGGRIVRWSVLGLGCLVTVLGSARLIYLGNYSGDAAAERVFCRIGICDEGTLNARLTAGRNGTGLWPSLEELRPYLQRSPARADLWVNVAAAAHRAGQSQAARVGFERAVQLAPFARPPLLEAASFFFDTGASGHALTLLRRSLEVSPANDPAVFALARAHGIAPATVLERIVTSTAEARSYMRWLMQPSPSDGTAQAWTVIVKRGHADAALAAEYAELLVERQQPQAAWAAWDLYARIAGLRQPADNQVSNGDFELNPAPTRFDWRISKSAGIVIRFDGDVKYSGGRSLRIAFNDAASPTEIGVRQMLYLEGRRYRFTAHVRTEGISIDEGIAFTIAREGSPALETTTRALRGTNDWTAIEHEFEAPAGGGLVRLSLTRQRSVRLDAPMRGIVWIDEIRLTLAE